MYVIYVHLSMLTGQTSLPPNQPNHLKRKKVHNFGIFYRIWLKLGVETKFKPLIEEYHKNDSFKLLEFLVVVILRSQRSFDHSNLMELVIFNPLRRGPNYCSDFFFIVLFLLAVMLLLVTLLAVLFHWIASTHFAFKTGSNNVRPTCARLKSKCTTDFPAFRLMLTDRRAD